MPRDPVIIKGLGHRIKDLANGRCFVYNGEKISSYASHIYGKLGSYESDVLFDDLELFDTRQAFEAMIMYL